jgi:hypothetical protein
VSAGDRVAVIVVAVLLAGAFVWLVVSEACRACRPRGRHVAASSKRTTDRDASGAGQG